MALWLLPPASHQLPDAVVRVLVAEDEPLSADQVESKLLGMGYETVGPTASTRVARALYRTKPAWADNRICSLTLADRSTQVR